MNEVFTGEVVQSRSPEQWARVVRGDLGQSVAGFVAAGQHLLQAKQQIDHGDWWSWIDRELPIGPSTVDKLMAIGQHAALTNPDHGTDLPTSWTTLYELSRLDPPQLETAISEGKVHPELERKQAKALVTKYQQNGKEKSGEVSNQASKKKRRPLPDFAKDAGWSLRKDVERVERVFADDRLAQNKEQVTTHLRSHLVYAVEVCQDLLNQIDEQ